MKDNSDLANARVNETQQGHNKGSQKSSASCQESPSELTHISDYDYYYDSDVSFISYNSSKKT